MNKNNVSSTVDKQLKRKFMKICRNLTFLSRLRQISRLKVVVISYFL